MDNKQKTWQTRVVTGLPPIHTTTHRPLVTTAEPTFHLQCQLPFPYRQYVGYTTIISSAAGVFAKTLIHRISLTRS